MKLLKFLAVLLVLTALWGCGKGNGSAAPTIDTATGKHAAGWSDIGAGGLHPTSYFNNRESCSECHGKDLKGGISKVSCSPGDNNIGCHPRFPHADGFADPTAHGKYATGVFTGFGIMGIAHCKNCHGYDFNGGPTTTYWAGPSCIKCHQARGANPSTNAPHGANWSSFVGRHSKTHSSNVPACFQCHANGQYSHAPPKPAPPGTEPGCFNGTLCHNDPLAHKIPFIAPTDHGNAIKNTYDWAYCANCHATASTNDIPRFNAPKGSMTNGCEVCHNKPFIAHPQMWLPGRGSGTPTTIGGVDAVKNTSHTSVPPAQVITSCTMCHGIAAPSVNPAVPSCATAGGKTIDGIRCHFTSPVTAQGQTVGCQSCHSFSSTSNPTFSTTYPSRDYKHSVHIPSINSLWPGLTPACYACHVNLGNGATHADGTGNVAVLGQFGGTYNATGQSCSGVSCHLRKPTPAWTATGSIGCVACHDNPDGSQNSGAHQKHKNAGVTSCNACHNGAGAGTPLHYDGKVEVSILSAYGASAVLNSDKTCSNVSCHGGKQTPAWSATSSGCTACHVNSDGSPNSGRHQKHLNGLELRLPCSSCHYGAGYGTPLHANGTVNIDISPQFDENGIANYSNPVLEQCTNLSCHGSGSVIGSTAFPKWTDNAPISPFDPQTCENCHVASNQLYIPTDTTIPAPYYIGPLSGSNIIVSGLSDGYPNQHKFHGASGSATCTDCHDTTGRHYLKINQGLGRRRILPGEAAATVKGTSITLNGYDSTTTSCTSTCHSVRRWNK